MKINTINAEFAVSDQISVADLQAIADAGYQTVICNRPDREEAEQTPYTMIAQEAQRLGLVSAYQPVIHSTISAADVQEFAELWKKLPKPILAYCRSGLRCTTLWSMMTADTAQDADQTAKPDNALMYHESNYDVVIVGAGASGISVASSLLNRHHGLRIVLIDPAETHYYQPGFTMIGGGIFESQQVKRPMASLIPKGVRWIQAAVATFLPEQNQLNLTDGSKFQYRRLIVCPGIKLNWAAIEGLPETLGKHGVTSNYRADLAPYTWKLVNSMNSGKAVFTQPPMPIKCAGAPQKALYLSADHWYRNGLIDNIKIDFYNAGGVLFGVKDYVPALQSYMNKYSANLHFMHRLIKVDGERKLAWFEVTDADGNVTVTETDFNMLHVCPPQSAPDFISSSPLADTAGWIDVDPATLQHKRYKNIWGLGDATNTSNAKTAAAVRKQVPVVAANIVADILGQPQTFSYDGYGSCPLTVERGKIVLAEFAYGGKLMPTLPTWMLDGTKPTAMAWHMKKSMLPALYWHGMLKGHELLVRPVAG